MSDATVPPPPSPGPQPEPARGGGGRRRLSAGAGILIGALLATVVAVGVVFAVTRDSGDEEVTLEASSPPPPSPTAVESSAAPSPSPSPSEASPSPSPSEAATSPASPPSDDTGTELCGAPVPQDAPSAVAGDLDGDGRDDLVYVSGTTVWVETAERVSDPYVGSSGASPVFSVSSADAPGGPAWELFVTTRGEAGSAIILLQLDGCTLGPVVDVDGDAFVFQVGVDPESDVLLGLGCVDVDGDGDAELVGTRAMQPDSDAAPYRVERTVVTIEGGTASVGATDVVEVAADDEQAVETLSAATCGESTLPVLIG